MRYLSSNVQHQQHVSEIVIRRQFSDALLDQSVDSVIVYDLSAVIQVSMMHTMVCVCVYRSSIVTNEIRCSSLEVPTEWNWRNYTTQQTQWTFACTNLLQTCRLCCIFVADLLRGSRQIVTDLLRGNWCNGFWPLMM